jgi:hypothetical protein
MALFVAFSRSNFSVEACTLSACSSIKLNIVPSCSGLTVLSSRHQQAPLVGTLRA